MRLDLAPHLPRSQISAQSDAWGSRNKGGPSKAPSDGARHTSIHCICGDACKSIVEMVCQVLDYLILEANKLRNAIPKVRGSTPTGEHPAPNSDGLVDEDNLYTSPPPAQPKWVSGIRQLPNSDNEEQEEIIANSSSTLTSTPVSSTQLPSTQFDAPPALTHPRSPQENPSHASQTPSSPLTNISTEDQPPPPKRSCARKPMEVERRPLSTHARGNKN